MKGTILKAVGMGAAVILILVLIAGLVVGFGFAIAFALTLMMNNMEMRQAIAPGAVFAGFSLHFFFRLLMKLVEKNEYSYRCDECREEDDDGYTPATISRPFVMKGRETKQAKRKTAHNKSLHEIGGKR